MTDRTADVRVVQTGDVPIVGVAGEIDMANAEAIRSELLALVPNTALGLVLDLSETQYIDSQGVHLVLRLGASLAAHGQQLRVAVPVDSHVRRILELTRIDEHVALDASTTESVEAIRAGS